MDNMIDVYNFNINSTTEKYCIGLDRFRSMDEFKYFVESVYKVDYSKIEEVMSEYNDLRLCDFEIEFRYYLISFIVNEKENLEKYKSKRFWRRNQIYKNFELGYCRDYELLIKHLDENQKLFDKLETIIEIDDELLYDLVDKHRKKELTYLEVIKILNEKYNLKIEE